MLQSILPASTFQAMAAESKQWYYVCSQCQHRKSYWELGGIRFGAASVHKKRYLKCIQCNCWQMFNVVKQ